MDKHFFNDSAGRRWACNVPIGVSMKLRDIGLDVAKIVDDSGSFVRALLADHWKLVQALEIVTERQRTEAGIELKDFRESLDGKALDEGFDALLYGIAGSLGKLQRRAIEAIIPTLSEGLEALANQVTERAKAQAAKVRVPDIGV